MAPVFSLVLDRDVSEELAMLYPELYKELTKVRLWKTTKLCLATDRVGPIAQQQDVLHLAYDQCLSR